VGVTDASSASKRLRTNFSYPLRAASSRRSAATLAFLIPLNVHRRSENYDPCRERPHQNTLIKFRYNRLFRGARGQHGEGSDRHGRGAEDLEIPVPVGTLVYDRATGILLHDFDRAEERWLAAAGGRGGKGNAHFASSINRAPRKAQDGELGEEKDLRLELKLLADVGLVGFPNAGKSTLISSMSAARPKISDYPFDIPGLIEGAHKGHGLGIQFLRHIERTRVLLFLIDVSVGNTEDPVAELEILRTELAQHDTQLASRPAIIVASKMDSADGPRVEKLEHWCGQEKIDFARISSITGKGLDELKRKVIEKLRSTDMTVDS